MRNQVHPLSQMLDSLLSTILNQTLTLACNCERKTLFCQLFFTTNEPTIYHSLYHILNLLIPHMNWLFIIYDRDFSTAVDEIFLWLLQILCNDSSISSAWSFMVTDNKIWEPESVIMNGSIINVDLQLVPQPKSVMEDETMMYHRLGTSTKEAWIGASLCATLPSMQIVLRLYGRDHGLE